ncbi:MAG: CHAT domain-containing protein, partial [Bacteroidetes bacterium]
NCRKSLEQYLEIMTIEQITSLITKARYKQALKAIRELEIVQQNDDLRLQADLLQTRYSKNERDNLMGIAENYGTESRRITAAMLMLLQDIKERQKNPTVPVAVTPAPTPEDEETELPMPGEEVTRILFLASNPSDTAKLQLTHEHSLISARLQEAMEPNKFPLLLKRAVTPSEFQRFIYQYKPNIVHFSGHGDRKAPELQAMLTKRVGRPGADSPQAEAVDPEQEESGIFLYDEDRRHSHFVSASYLKRVFKSMVQRQNIPIKIVVFNACHSGQQAQAISNYVPYVIGTSWSVGDKAASAFAAGFYFGIAEGMEVEDAVDYAINETLPYNEPEDRFILYKDGIKVEW